MSHFQVRHGEFRLLLDEAKQGSRDALGRLCRNLDRVLRYRIQRRLRGLPAQVKEFARESDFLQDTFVAVQQSLADFRGDTPEEFLSWVLRIQATCINGKFRHASRLKRHAPSTVSLKDDAQRGLRGQLPAPELSPAVCAEQRDWLTHILRQLPAVYRYVFCLHAFEGESFVEIGCRLLRSPDAVRKTYARAVSLLRHVYGRSRKQD